MRQRVRQFFAASRKPTEADLTEARQHLSSELLTLFLAQHPRDIVHAVETARYLLARGYSDADVLAAALLHDIGKGQQRRWDRVAYVVAGWVRLDAAVASSSSRLELRRAMTRSLVHSEAGARLLEGAGAPPRVVALTRLHHAQPNGDAMLAALQEADAAS
jgi:putative nucleotidyltransferase with HDIG domain